MAKAVEAGAKTVQSVDVALAYHAKPQDVQDYDGIIFGVPTYNHRMTMDIQIFLEKLAQSNIALKGKIAAAFGSYGWSGEAPNQVLEVLKNKFQMRTFKAPVLANYKPDDKTLEKCRELGRKVAEALLKSG